MRLPTECRRPAPAVRDPGGFALIAVLVALGILLALAVPFLLRMGHGEAVARHLADEKKVDLLTESVRDWLLRSIELGHTSVDETPLFDSRDEFRSGLQLPEAFAALQADGVARHLLSAEAYDLQQRINLNSASPLLLANVLDLATNLSVEHSAEAGELSVDSTAAFPDAGLLIVDRELIRYARKTPSSFTDLERGLLSDRGFAPAEDHALSAGLLVLDFRVVLAVTHSFYFPKNEQQPGTAARGVLRPWSSVDQLTGLEALGLGSFSSDELDVLRHHCTVASIRDNAADWGRPERIFNDAPAGTRILRVRSATFIGGGSVVRIRSLDGKKHEYGLVWSTEMPAGFEGNVNLPSNWYLSLLLPVTQDFAEIETVVEPLLPHPVNVNTASQQVLAALIEHVRQAPRSRRHDVVAGSLAAGFSATEARDLALQLRAMRGDTDLTEEEAAAITLADEPAAFRGFEDLARRFFWPRFADAQDSAKQRLMLLYRTLETGLPGVVEMGTAPLCFASAPMVHYRAAALRHRFGREAARREVQGEAVVMPGRSLDLVLATQTAMEEAFRLDRRSPFFQTLPINLGALTPADPGADPAPRFTANILPRAFDDAGFGQPRFASPDANGAGFRPSPSTTRFEPARGVASAFDSMWHAQHPEGFDTAEAGRYVVENSRRAAQARDHRVRFPFTNEQGLPEPHAVSFWFQPRQIADQALYDLADDEPLRNRISLQVREGHLIAEVYDEAGQDPDAAQIAAAQTSPERTAGTWKVPLTDLPMEADTWFHANLSAYGNRPDQVSFLVDGVPRHAAELRTHLTRLIPAYDRRNVNQRNDDPRTDAQRFLEVAVEDASSFPPRGVLRIGLELFEYSSRTDTVFDCEYRDSIGGRFARMDLFEFRPGIPVDGDGRPTKNPNNIGGSANDDIAPEHAIGTAVELYGYAAPLYRDERIATGSAQLQDALGAFAVARILLDPNDLKPIMTISQRPVVFGRGMEATYDRDIPLGDPRPMVGQNAQYTDLKQAEQRIQAAFPASGGYALLVQRQYDVSDLLGGTVAVGGIELIRYGSRTGNKLTNVKRGLPNPHTTQNQNRWITGTQNNYVLDWVPYFVGDDGKTKYNEFPQVIAYVVPISIAVRGSVVDPTTLGRSEWLQIYPTGSESDTEWVRYDFLYDGTHLTRGMPGAWTQTLRSLTLQNAPESYQLQPGQAIPPVRLDTIEPYGRPQQFGIDYIGYTDRIEVDFPACRAARQGLDFRGDTFTETTSHAQPTNAVVLPVHRLELDWGNYGALTGRAGRMDRVALVGGSQATAGERPPVEWHTINWSARRPEFDIEPGSGGGGTGNQRGVERLGAFPFQLFALQAPVRQLFIGPADRNPLLDPRRVDRLVKFPSGELPAAEFDGGWLGATRHEDAPPSGALFDELWLITHPGPALTLEEPLAEDGQQFAVRTDLRADATGPLVVRDDLTARYPTTGGLVSIDGEIIAYTSHSNGRFQIATNARGLLLTEPRAHDAGARVHFLDHVPAAILTAGVGQGSHQFVVENMGALPRWGGTLLIGRTELAHYCWSYDTKIMQMPEWIDPATPQMAGRGLLRGRYGTAPASAAAGEPLIWFPFRYWDRHHERADDPELGYFQITFNEAPVYFSGLYWDEAQADALVDVHCLVRINGQGSFADDPQGSPHLLRFTDGVVNDKPNPILRQASRLEARFFPVFRAGAFDPVQFRANAWKRAATVRAVLVNFEGETRILSERVTAR